MCLSTYSSTERHLTVNASAAFQTNHKATCKEISCGDLEDDAASPW